MEKGRQYSRTITFCSRIIQRDKKNRPHKYTRIQTFDWTKQTQYTQIVGGNDEPIEYIARNKNDGKMKQPTQPTTVLAAPKLIIIHSHSHCNYYGYDSINNRDKEKKIEREREKTHTHTHSHAKHTLSSSFELERLSFSIRVVCMRWFYAHCMSHINYHATKPNILITKLLEFFSNYCGCTQFFFPLIFSIRETLSDVHFSNWLGCALKIRRYL